MHVGTIQNPKTAAGRVYDRLLEANGKWMSGWDLSISARVTAVGTRVSEVRHQLPARQRIEHKTSHEGVSGSWYRLVVDRYVPQPEDFPAGRGVKNCPCVLVPVEKPGAPFVFTEAGEALRERARLLADRRTGQLGTVAPQTRLNFQRSST